MSDPALLLVLGAVAALVVIGLVRWIAKMPGTGGRSEDWPGTD